MTQPGRACQQVARRPSVVSLITDEQGVCGRAIFESRGRVAVSNDREVGRPQGDGIVVSCTQAGWMVYLMAMALQRGSRRIHSMPIEPEPAP